MVVCELVVSACHSLRCVRIGSMSRDMELPTTDCAYVFGISNIMLDTTDQSNAKLRVVMVQEDVLLALRTELRRRHTRRSAAGGSSEKRSVDGGKRLAASTMRFDDTLGKADAYEDDEGESTDKADWFRSGLWRGLCEMALRYRPGTQGICGPMMRIELAVPAGWAAAASVGEGLVS